MGNNGDANGRLRFEDFELDLRTRELHINGTKVTLQEQPFQVLIALLEHPGGLVTREELRQRLWSSDTFVNFDLSLNKAVNRLRDVLQDSAQTPHLIETLPRRGYRFVGRIPENPPNGGTAAGLLIRAESHTVSQAAKNRGWRLWSLLRVLIWMALLGAIVFIAFSVLPYSPPVVLQAQPITKDGRAKAIYATVATDGSRVYFEEVVAGREIAAQVSVAGGETAEIPIPMKGTIADISPDGSRMLFGAEMPGGIQLWLQPLPTGPANRVGDLSAIDAGWAPDGLSFVFINNREVFWAKAD